MTENKRFNYHIDEVGMYYYVCDNTKKGDDRIILEFDTKFDAIEVCNLLNSLNDDNEQLKQVIDDYGSSDVSSCMNTIFKLAKENEQLKQKHRQLQIDFNDACIITHNLKEKVLDLEDENEQLKQRNEFLKKQLDRVCSENEIIGDKLKKIGRTL